MRCSFRSSTRTQVKKAEQWIERPGGECINLMQRRLDCLLLLKHALLQSSSSVSITLFVMGLRTLLLDTGQEACQLLSTTGIHGPICQILGMLVCGPSRMQLHRNAVSVALWWCLCNFRLRCKHIHTATLTVDWGLISLQLLAMQHCLRC